jgi:hypothetical protein
MSLARKCVATLVVGGVGWWAGACVSEETTPVVEQTWPFPDETSFCAKLGEVVCNDEVVTDCYGSSEASLPDDKAACAEAYGALSQCNPNGFTYHPETAQACIDAMTLIWTDARVDETELEDATEACIEVFYEPGAVGDACTLDGECETPEGLRCVIKDGDTEGTCRVPDRISGGYSCDAPDAICAEAFYCDATFHCTERPGINDACSPTMPCSTSTLCNPTTELCDAKRDNGVGCTAAEQCLNGFCNKPRNSDDGVCGATMTLDGTSANCAPFLP